MRRAELGQRRAQRLALQLRRRRRTRPPRPAGSTRSRRLRSAGSATGRRTRRSARPPRWTPRSPSFTPWTCFRIPGAATAHGLLGVWLTHLARLRSGAGLHVGHPEGYTATDILARYKVRMWFVQAVRTAAAHAAHHEQRMAGFNVLHPMGWDAFGLPAEQYAIDTGTHPSDTTKRNINRFREQLKVGLQ